jgi:hypothetical protein
MIINGFLNSSYDHIPTSTKAATDTIDDMLSIPGSLRRGAAALAGGTLSRFSARGVAAHAPAAAFFIDRGAGEWPPLRSRAYAIFPFSCSKNLRSSRAQGIPTRLAAGSSGSGSKGVQTRPIAGARESQAVDIPYI